MTTPAPTSPPPPAYRSIATVKALTKALDTTSLFEASFTETNLSPLDQLIDNTDSINKMYLDYMKPGSPPVPQELGALVVLGYMSAVESYFRALLRGLINIDEYAQRLVEGRAITFGAAMHHSSALLPEALLEETSLAAEENVIKTLRDLGGVTGNPPPDVAKVLSEYHKLCQIRHCCVHRFGRLGTRNAIALGLHAHKAILEKPLKASVDDLQSMAEVLRTFAKTINNYVFASVLQRTATNKDNQKAEKIYQKDWSWRLKQDRARFRRYYKLFATIKDAHPSSSADDIYKSFRAEFRKRRR